MEEKDILLLTKAQEDKRAYEQIYLRYSKRIYEFCLHRLGQDEETAQDITQETFLRAFRNLSRYCQKGYSYFGYLLTIARNLLVNYYKKHRPLSLEGLPEERIADQNLDPIEKKLFHKQAQSIIKHLPPPDQQILFLRYDRELPIKEIAKLLHKSENAIKLRLSRIKKKLRVKLK